MGLLNESQQSYYESTNKGNYQFVSLNDIISSFMVVYVGESKILNRVSRTDVQFHGMRAIQELSYDVLRSHKAFEQEVPATLVMPLPQDYVNYTKIVRVDSKGVEKPLYPTGKTSNPFPIDQGSNLTYQYESDGSLKDQGASTNYLEPYKSDTRDRFKSIEANNITYDYDDGDLIDEHFIGRRYGLDPQHAQINGTFYIDNSTGFIHFGSDLSG